MSIMNTFIADDTSMTSVVRKFIIDLNLFKKWVHILRKEEIHCGFRSDLNLIFFHRHTSIYIFLCVINMIESRSCFNRLYVLYCGHLTIWLWSRKLEMCHQRCHWWIITFTMMWNIIKDGITQWYLLLYKGYIICLRY